MKWCVVWSVAESDSWEWKTQTTKRSRCGCVTPFIILFFIFISDMKWNKKKKYFHFFEYIYQLISLCVYKHIFLGDHPPITPMRLAEPHELGGTEWRIYEYMSSLSLCLSHTRTHTHRHTHTFSLCLSFFLFCSLFRNRMSVCVFVDITKEINKRDRKRGKDTKREMDVWKYLLNGSTVVVTFSPQSVRIVNLKKSVEFLRSMGKYLNAVERVWYILDIPVLCFKVFLLFTYILSLPHPYSYPHPYPFSYPHPYPHPYLLLLWLPIYCFTFTTIRTVTRWMKMWIDVKWIQRRWRMKGWDIVTLYPQWRSVNISISGMSWMVELVWMEMWCGFEDVMCGCGDVVWGGKDLIGNGKM